MVLPGLAEGQSGWEGRKEALLFHVFVRCFQGYIPGPRLVRGVYLEPLGPEAVVWGVHVYHPLKALVYIERETHRSTIGQGLSQFLQQLVNYHDS